MENSTAGDRPLLEVRDLRVGFAAKDGLVGAVRGIDLSIQLGQRVGLVGESGCGKTSASMAVASLLPENAHVQGSIRYKGVEVLGQPERVLRQMRGADIAVIYQDPFSSLNPMHRVVRQIGETVILHSGLKGKALEDEVSRLLQIVGIANAREVMALYPHQLSGGMRQRVMIAMALAGQPQLLIADELTTALDVTIQAQIVKLLGEIAGTTGMALLLITHDMGVIARLVSHVNVMYAGLVVESGSTEDVLVNAVHPYTVGLMQSTPRIDRRTGGGLRGIPGQPPRAGLEVQGCPFAPRCERQLERCLSEMPGLEPVAGEADVSSQTAGDAGTGTSCEHKRACWNPLGTQRRQSSG